MYQNGGEEIVWMLVPLSPYSLGRKSFVSVTVLFSLVPSTRLSGTAALAPDYLSRGLVSVTDDRFRLVDTVCSRRRIWETRL